MSVRWRIYFLTLLSYAITHALRTMWSALKSTLTTAPFDYQLAFLGTIDMVVLFVIAVFMNILGSKVERWGAKKALILTLAALLLFNTIIGIFLNLDLTEQWLYVVFFGVGVGIASSTAWPSCLYMVSLYFKKSDGITLSAWNGTSQLGDFISLGTFFIIVAAKEWQPQSCFFLGSLYLLIMLILVALLIPNKLNETKEEQASPHAQEGQKDEGQVAAEGHVELKEEGLEANEQQQDKKLECISQGSEQEAAPNHQAKLGQQGQSAKKSTRKRVNILTVWKLPGVALNVLSYGFIKSVNAFIVSWMVFYLISLDMGSEAVLVTILWSVSVFIGGLLCGFINRRLSKLFFVFQLMAATVAFIFLEQMHYNIYQVEIIVSLVLCGLFYGGPYGLMSTAIPISLGSQPAVQEYENGMSAIISLVEGYGMFFCGISLLLLPLWGVEKINLVAACYCGAAILLLLGEMYRDRMKSEAKEQAKLHAKSHAKEQSKPQQKDTPLYLDV